MTYCDRLVIYVCLLIWWLVESQFVTWSTVFQTQKKKWRLQTTRTWAQAQKQQILPSTSTRREELETIRTWPMYTKAAALTLLWKSTLHVLSVDEHILVYVATPQNLPLWPCIGPPPPQLFPAAVEGNTEGIHTTSCCFWFPSEFKQLCCATAGRARNF